MYLEERLRIDGSLSEQLEKDLEELRAALALGPKEAKLVQGEVTTLAYRCSSHPAPFWCLCYPVRGLSTSSCHHSGASFMSPRAGCGVGRSSSSTTAQYEAGLS